jgi:GNAT superfamily N-acetyltransferase
MLKNERIVEMVRYLDPSNLSVLATEPEWHAGNCRVDCPIKTPAGSAVGSLELAFWDCPEGVIACIDELSLAEPSRSRGFGRRWLAHFERRCAETGIRAIELWARGVGGYFWANAGFEFRKPDPDQRDQITDDQLPVEITQLSVSDALRDGWLAGDWLAANRINERLDTLVADNTGDGRSAEEFRRAVPTVEHLRAGAAPELRTAAEIAAFGKEAAWTESNMRMWLGKKLMTDSDWWGEKQLQARF